MSVTKYNPHPPRKDRRLLLSVLFSFVIHLSIFFYQLDKTSSTAPVPPSQERFVELSQLPKELTAPPRSARNQPNNQVVETEDAGNRDLDPNATLLSDKNQKAQQQTKAQRVDNFEKGQGKGARNEEIQEQGENEAQPSDELSLGLGTNPSAKRKSWKNLSLKDLSVNGDGNSVSASDDYLPNVASGERTILSTREFRYFSYYNRIKELLRQHWKPSIEREVSKLWGKGQMLKENELVTRVFVLLDKSGQVQKISKVGASGVSEIDEVAVQSFYHASPFPNPPVGLVEPDGYVRINWDFILQTAAAPQIQFRPSAASPRFR